MELSKRDLMNLLEKEAKLYRLNANDSLRRNGHMNDYAMKGREDVPQEIVDALLVDFINYVGTGQGLDEGLYVHNLKKD
jgi:hypothetical protein